MKPHYFSSLLPELSIRAAHATVSRLGFSNSALRAHLTRAFSSALGEPGSFLGNPVFEATFGWETADRTMSSLAPQLLTPSLVDAMDAPGGENGSSYRFPRDTVPYKHQLQAWEFLSRKDAQSVVVTSGTGSGKTECFMVPILDQLVREYEEKRAKLVGVRALFLYPLNALIQSQRERLHAWTSAFGDGVRFCLYNGNTPHKAPQHERDRTPNQVIDREALRAAPPPMLVTNATMLEYMLVRSQDAPILDGSKGKLNWIVLDEAHTYIGSQAAELALLLRRVLHAFDVRPEDVRFVATSATIGDEEAEAKLRDFLAALAGVAHSRVHVVSGHRKIPALAAGDLRYRDAGLEGLEALPPADSCARYQALCANQTATRVRNRFVPAAGGSAANTLTEIAAAVLGPYWQREPDAIEQALRWLDLLTSACADAPQGGFPFLPLRLHAFHNVLAGLWACGDPDCSCKHDTPLASPDWPFGKVYTEERRHCECGAPVYELRSCNDCNSTFLWARRVLRKVDGRYRLLQIVEDGGDEFALDIEVPDDDQDTLSDIVDDSTVLIANGHTAGTAEVLVARDTLILDPADCQNTLRLRVRDEMQTDDGAAMVCPECGGHHSHGKNLFRRAILGAPFLLSEIIPTLLEYCPDIDESGIRPKERPLRGRRMITFTDSRQGTARIAAKLQQDAERNRVRGLVYQRAILAAQPSITPAAAEIQDHINSLKSLNNPAVAGAIASLESQLASMMKRRPIGLAEAVDWLATNEPDVRDWMHEFYAEADPAEFGGALGKEKVSRILVIREFARRPKRLNSLETMGLVAVHYPKLDNVRQAPSVLGNTPLSLADWRDFLKIALDFYVRESTFISLPSTWKKWGGTRLSSKQLLPPDSKEQQTSRLKRWPQCNPVGTQSRLVRLMAYVLRLDSATDCGRDVIDTLLRSAWDDLIGAGLLQKASDGRFLALEDLAFAPITKGWVCPVTRRVLDVTLRSITPYLPNRTPNGKVAECKPINLPHCELLARDFRSEEERLETIRQWLNDDPVVASLRAEGLWSDLSDRVVEGSAYFRTAEHSAQQSGSRLEEYERDFKSGRINLLSCSTTMEMGVDIGGITVVAMNNVPPHPANYLQRAGRAGRRSETRSVALTVCKNNPHDQYVFGNTLWPFRTALPAPSISLSSPILVQRHLNSMLLARFLRLQLAGQGDIDKLDMEWWILPKGEARANQFIAWARCFDEGKEASLASGLRSLLRHTCYEGVTSLSRLVAETATMLEVHCSRWYREFDAIEFQLGSFQGAARDREPAYKALQIQRKRLTGEYLLRELAAEGFLPGYGFPTDISSFETLTCDEIERNKARKKEGRIDNLFRHRELPSRDTVTALREYAPGADVVIDGLVYRSAGITLNWHAPASVQAIKEIQSIREAWRCRTCGSSGTTVTADHLSHCPDCGAGLPVDPDCRFTYLEPAGFSVDLYESPHNDVSTQTYVPVESPWINAAGDWLPLANPHLGIYRSSTTGSVFNYSAGTGGHGYAICLDCGRAEPMVVEVDDATADDRGIALPKVFRDPHRRLRGAQGGQTAICEGSNKKFAIKPGVRLGHSMTTDVLELMLYGLDGQPLSDKPVAYSLAVAVRSAISDMLGVEVEELGCDTKPIRLRGTIGQAIVVFDRNASGYCSSVASRLREVLARGLAALNCSAECDGACQHCLLHYDTRFRMDDLDRHAAASFLSSRWLDKLELREEDAQFGRGRSGAEFQALPEAITRELARPGIDELRLFLAGDPADWDIATSPLRRWVQKWSASSSMVKLVIPEATSHSLSQSDRFALYLLANLDGVSVWAGQAPSCEAGGQAVAELIGGDRPRAWAYASAGPATPNKSWGESLGSLLVIGEPQRPSMLDALLPIDTQAPAEMSGRVCRAQAASELDGVSSGFGTKLLALLEQSLDTSIIAGSGDLTRVSYQDRYLNAPLPVVLLVEFLSALKTTYSERWAVQSAEIVVAPLPEEPDTFRRSTKVFNNWPSGAARDDAIQAALAYCGLDCTVRTMPKRDAMHARVLELETADGHVTRVWLDQGFSYWQVPRTPGHPSNSYASRFQFDASASAQGQAIAEAKIPIEGQIYPTSIFVEQV